MQTLASWIAQTGKLPVPDAVGWVVRLSKALEPIHLLGIAHGRLSTDAVVMAGTSCRDDGAVVGTTELADAVAYHCPDRARGKDASIESDTWAVAVILYEAVTGERPFQATTGKELLAEIAGGGPAPLSRFGVDREDLQDLLRQALALSRKRRLRSLRKLRDALIELEPEAGDLRALQLGTMKPGDEGYDEIEDAVTQKLDDVTALTRMALIKKGAIPDVVTAQPTEPDEDEEELDADDLVDEGALAAGAVAAGEADAAVEDAGEADVDAEEAGDGDAAAYDEQFLRPSLIDEDDQEATQVVDVSHSAELAALRVDVPSPKRNGLLEDDTVQRVQLRKPLPPPRKSPDEAEVAEPAGDADDEGEGFGALPKAARGIDFGEIAEEPASSRGADLFDEDRIDEGALRSGGAQVPEPVAPRDERAAPAGPAAGPAARDDALHRDAPPAPAVEPPAPSASPTSAAQPTAAPIDAAEQAPPSRRGGPVRTFLRLVLLAFIGAAAALLLFRPDARRDFVVWVHARTGILLPLPGTELTPAVEPVSSAEAVPVPAASAASSHARDPGSSPATASSAPAPGTPSGSAAPTASASATGTPPGPADVAACVMGLFPEGSFAPDKHDFSFVCTETNPRKGANALGKQIVLGGGSEGATKAMQQWALLDWYEMGAFAAVRARCCAEDAPPLVTPASLAHCELDESMDSLRVAVVGSKKGAVADAVAAYTKSMHCLDQVGASSVFGLSGPPQGGARSAFEELVRRIRDAG